MLTTQSTLDIDATPDQVWAVLGRFMHVGDFHPRITTVDRLSEAETGVGATRKCHFRDGSSVVERVVDWQEGRSYSAELTGHGMPLVKAVATLGVDSLEGGRSRLRMGMAYQVKYGPIGWLMGKTMMARMMGRQFGIVLRGLEERVTKGPKAKAA